METDTKRPANGAEEESSPRAKRKRTDQEPDDAEVEAFFAILQRMRNAVRCFGGVRSDGNGNGNGKERGKETGLLRWKPAFEWEDFEEEEVKDDGARPQGAEAEERTAGFLDLNADPEPEGGDDTAAEEVRPGLDMFCGNGTIYK